MALIRKTDTPYTSLQGVASQDFYARVNNIVFDYIANQATIYLDIYASKTAYEAGKEKLEREEILVTGDNFTNYLADSAIKLAGSCPCEQAEAFLLNWTNGEGQKVYNDWELEK